MLNYVIIIVIIILLLNVLKTHAVSNYDHSLIKKNIDDIHFNTGDIIFFRHDCPLYFYGNNGINMDIHIFKNACKTLFYYNQSYFSHCGIVIIRNNIPYILHLTADDNYDNYTKKCTIGTPVLSSMNDVYKYKGFLYYNKYVGPRINNIELILTKIYNTPIYLDGNIFNALMVNLMGIGNHKQQYMVCCDFVLFVMNILNIVNTFKYCDLNYISNICKTNNHYISKQILIKTQLYKCLL
jgi:hypothetical protein